MKKLLLATLLVVAFSACSFEHHVSGVITHKVEIDLEALSDLFVAICKDNADPAMCLAEVNDLFFNQIVVGEKE